MKIPHFKIIDKRNGDLPDDWITEKASSIDYINGCVCYINEYGEEEAVPFDDEDCELIEEKE